MICPRCDTVNKDNATECVNCGIRLAGTPMRPGAQKTENRYLAVGTAIAIIMVAILVLVLWSFSCICSGCHNADENSINQNVEGDYIDEEVVSDSAISYADLPSFSDAEALPEE